MKPGSMSLTWLLLLAGCHSLTYVPHEPAEAGSGENMLPCVDNKFCVRGTHWDTSACDCVADAPSDAGMASDAGGPACVDNQLCVRGLHWDRDLCACAPDADAGSGGDREDAGRVCVQNQACVKGAHWDRDQCACVGEEPAGGMGGSGGAGEGGSGGAVVAGMGGAPGCVENQLCVQGQHWDASACACVPDEPSCGDATCAAQEHCCQVADASDGSCVSRCETVCPGQPCTAPAPDAGAADGCRSASDCSGPLPQLCEVCASLDGLLNLGSGCAHWACRDHQCEIAFCD